MKHLHAVLLCLLIATLAAAQGKPFQFGLCLAPELTTGSLEKGSGFGYGFRFSYGLTSGLQARHLLSEKFSLRTGFFQHFRKYTLRVDRILLGSCFSTGATEQGETLTDEVSAIFFSAPLFIEWRPAGRWLLFAGPSIDFLIKENRKRSSDNACNGGLELTTDGRSFDRRPVSLVVGLGKSFAGKKTIVDVAPSCHFTFHRIGAFGNAMSKAQFNAGLQVSLWLL